jgi:2-polyprenyl-3-methyl-5-hydroxy-6-metoxy-1,4-benzoquinol methylase
MDHCEISAGMFHKHAGLYREKFMDLTMYDEGYLEFCRWLKPARARVLDAACGPGNVARYLMSQRPDLDLLGIDLAPRMVELAQEAVPAARFALHDCRRLGALRRRFDGIICAFGLPYLSEPEAAAFIQTAAEILEPEGVLYLSTMLGRAEDSGAQKTTTGDEVFVYYHSENQILDLVRACGFSLISHRRLASPSAASKPTTDLILIAQKRSSKVAETADSA